MVVRRRLCLVVPKEKVERKVFSRSSESYQKGGPRTYLPEKGAGKDFNPHEGRGKDRKGKDRKVPILNLDFQPLETPSEERCGYSWESDDRSSSLWPDDSSTSAPGWSCTRAHTAWMAAVPLNLAQMEKFG